MSPRRIDRRTALAAVVVVSVAFAGGGLVGSRVVRSPQEVAASREPPAPSVLTAVVEHRRLVESVVTRGQVVVGRRLDVALTGSGEVTPVVTGVRVRPGRTVRSGDVVAEVSGRPVLVLAGTVPAYRDLLPGSHGADVSQLQRALAGIGFPVGSDADGVLGSTTQEALRRYYASVGYDVPTTGSAEDVSAANTAAKAAQRAVQDAKVTLRRARAAAVDPEDPRAHAYAVQDARRALRQAIDDERDARSALADVRASSGPMLPLAEHAFVPSLPATVAEVSARVGAPADGPGLSLDLGEPRVETTVDPARRGLLRVDQTAKVLLDAGGSDASCRVAAIGPEKPQESGGLAHQVSLACPDLDRSRIGADVRITIRAASTAEPVLVVPLAAVTTSADGQAKVVVHDRSGSERRVLVTAGLSADGYVAVRPASAGDLSPGDQVVVGE